MRRMKAQKNICTCTCIVLCLCFLCIFVHSPAITHPAAYQSSPLCLSVCIDLLPPSVTLRLIHASAGQREGLWHSEGMSQPSQGKQILCLQQTLGVAALTARHYDWSNMQTFKSNLLISAACSNNKKTN